MNEFLIQVVGIEIMEEIFGHSKVFTRHRPPRTFAHFEEKENCDRNYGIISNHAMTVELSEVYSSQQAIYIYV